MINRKCSLTIIGIILISLSSLITTYAQEKIAPSAKVTLDNLLTAYSGEINANARYLAFAKKADAEGYPGVASLFRASAKAEQIHYEHSAQVIKTLGGTPTAKTETPVVRATAKNLESAIESEVYENQIMYPEFLAKAKKEKVNAAIDVLEDSQAAGAVHVGWYKKALKNLESWKAKPKEFFVCPLCGNVVDVIPGPACPICMEDTKKFIPVS